MLKRKPDEGLIFGRIGLRTPTCRSIPTADATPKLARTILCSSGLFHRGENVWRKRHFAGCIQERWGDHYASEKFTLLAIDALNTAIALLIACVIQRVFQGAVVLGQAQAPLPGSTCLGSCHVAPFLLDNVIRGGRFRATTQINAGKNNRAKQPSAQT
ncbi:hypothetical protein SISNIDRAFT_105749 [Sistotremastrum niveocremeum HHB9708]|uniref:Uncharacterized protein n=1 Tax=Sistotremastrum niveocremeum HHB9708 TaxID=1314777 RepID=A0A164TV67_9AGAM|nr:hypothetical protein SISNIDRAFT_105749 [Sistotremastrum niveocremeum HHB9708]